MFVYRCIYASLSLNELRGGMAPCGVIKLIFHENVNFLFVAQKCQVIHAFHKTHKQNVIALIETHILGDFINNMVFGDQMVSTQKRRWWAAFSSIFWKIYSHNWKGPSLVSVCNINMQFSITVLFYPVILPMWRGPSLMPVVFPRDITCAMLPILLDTTLQKLTWMLKVSVQMGILFFLEVNFFKIIIKNIKKLYFTYFHCTAWAVLNLWCTLFFLRKEIFEFDVIPPY